MSFKVFFVTVCPVCSHNNKVRLARMGHRVDCLKCNNNFIAKDPEIESAAMQENAADFARILDWPLESVAETKRPR